MRVEQQLKDCFSLALRTTRHRRIAYAVVNTWLRYSGNDRELFFAMIKSAAPVYVVTSSTLKVACSTVMSDGCMQSRHLHGVVRETIPIIQPRSPDRQRHLDGHTVAYIQCEPQSPAVAFDDRAADGEAHAERAGLGGNEHIEHAIHVRFRNSSDGIAHRKIER